MKRFFYLVLLTLVVTAPAAGDVSFSVLGSSWETDALDDLTGAGVRATFGGPTWAIDFTGITDGGTDFSVTSGDDTAILDLETHILELGVRRYLSRPGNTKSYAGLGVSVVRLDSNYLPAIDSEVGGYALLGLEIGRGRAAFVAEVFYRDVEPTLDMHDLVDFVWVNLLTGIEREGIFDIPLGGVGVNFGVVFRPRR